MISGGDERTSMFTQAYDDAELAKLSEASSPAPNSRKPTREAAT